MFAKQSIAKQSTLSLTLIGTTLFFSNASSADPVIGWNLDTSFGGGMAGAVLSDPNTDSPTIGDGTDDGANNTAIWAEIPTTQIPEGKTLVLSGEVELVDSENELLQFRWGLFHETAAGTPDPTSGWDGYMADAVGFPGLFQKDPSLDPPPKTFASVFVHPELDDSPYTGNPTVGSYAFEMTITRQADLLDITATLNGIDPHEFHVDYEAVDHEPLPALDFTFNRVGFLMGAVTHADQVVFSGIDVTLIPEPASLCLLASGILCVLARRRGKTGCL